MILVTGATGMLGGHLVWHLLQENEKIIALMRENSNSESLKNIFRFYTHNDESACAYYSRVEWRQADITDYETLLPAFEGVEYVYHCAAMVNLGKNNRQMYRVNTDGTANVVNAALNARVKKLCFVSSIASLSDGVGTGAIDEDTPVNEHASTSVYGISKRLAEREVQAGEDKGLRTVVVNPGVILGYSKEFLGSGELFRRVRKGLPFYTNGTTGYISVEDTATAMILLMKSDACNERFILVSENITHKKVLCWMADGYGRYRPFIGMRKSLLVAARVLEFMTRFFCFTPLIDMSSARIAISAKMYSNQKFISLFPCFRFKSVKETISEICKADLLP